MVRLALIIIFVFVVGRAIWRLLDGIIDGISQAGGGRAGVPQRGVQMVRDPVCGTFIVPANALTLMDGGARVYFCSDACRDAYRKRPPAGRDHVKGRTA
jgi:YHS domain-containing protein